MQLQQQSPDIRQPGGLFHSRGNTDSTLFVAAIRIIIMLCALLKENRFIVMQSADDFWGCWHALAVESHNLVYNVFSKPVFNFIV